MDIETDSYLIKDKNLIKVNPGYEGIFIIPDGVEEIGEDAFLECSKITSIVIPKSVSRIKNNSFKNCSSLIEITIPENVIKISSTAFVGCENLLCIRILNRNTLVVFNSIPETTTIIIGNELSYDNLYNFMKQTKERDNENFTNKSKQKIITK